MARLQGGHIHVTDVPSHGSHPWSYMSFEGLPDVPVGGSLDHGILAEAVRVFLGLDHVGDHLHQPVLREGVVGTHHVHLRGWRCVPRLLTHYRGPPHPVSHLFCPAKWRPQPVLRKSWGDQTWWGEEAPEHPSQSPPPRHTHLLRRGALAEMPLHLPDSDHCRVALGPSLHPPDWDTPRGPSLSL